MATQIQGVGDQGSEPIPGLGIFRIWGPALHGDGGWALGQYFGCEQAVLRMKGAKQRRQGGRQDGLYMGRAECGAGAWSVPSATPVLAGSRRALHANDFFSSPPRYHYLTRTP